MISTLRIAIVFLALLLAGCKSNTDKTNDSGNRVNAAKSGQSEVSEFSLTGLHSQNDSILLRIAFLGDAEPKPLAEFPYMDAAVKQINRFNQTQAVDLVIGVGDIAHKGTEIQYEAATDVLENLEVPFYPIMGNEEHGSTLERYLYYAKKWNSDIVSPSYILNHSKLAFVLASPDYGRDFDDEGATWILEQIQRLAPKPVILVVHGAQIGVYPEKPDKGIHNQLFREQVISQPNLAMIISGDLHMDMERVNHSKKIENVHYLHIPALERTKVPDKSNHTPMIRVMTIEKNGEVNIDTYTVMDFELREEHNYSFMLSLK